MAAKKFVLQELAAENTNAKSPLGIMLLGTAMLIIISSIVISCWHIVKASSASSKVLSFVLKIVEVSYVFKISESGDSAKKFLHKL